MKKKSKLKLNYRKIHRQNETVYIGNYKWPNAYAALKGYFVYCICCHRNPAKASPEVDISFVKDVVSGVYDNAFNELKSIVEHPQKEELVAINCTSFNDLLRSNPDLMMGALIR